MKKKEAFLYTTLYRICELENIFMHNGWRVPPCLPCKVAGPERVLQTDDEKNTLNTQII